MKAIFSIRDKLTVIILIVGILVTSIVGYFSYINAKEALLERTFDQLTSVRIEKKKRLENYFFDRISEINRLAAYEDVKHIIHMLDSNQKKLLDNNRVLEEFDAYLNKQLYLEKAHNAIVFKSKDGSLLKIIPGVENAIIKNFDKNSLRFYKDLWKKSSANNRVILSDLHKNSINGEYVFNITKSVYDKGNLTGMISLQLSVDFVNQIMFDNNPLNGLGKSGESYLVGSDYKIRSTSRFVENSVMNTVVKTEGVHSAFKGEVSTDIIDDYRGISVLSSYSKINLPDLNWVILAEIDFEEAMIPIDNIRNKILLISITLLVLLFSFAYYFSMRISSPIIKLKDAAKSLGEGETAENLKISSNDEIGQLTDAFNDMAKSINEHKEFLRIEKLKSLQALIDGQEKERKRLSAELHDSLGQLLIALKLQHENMFDDVEMDEANKEFSKLIDHTIAETRNISNNLMPSLMSEFGLDTTINNLCKTVMNSSNIIINYRSNISDIDINDECSLYVFRIIQEALNNSVKYAEAENIDVVINKIDIGINVNIKDDGKGFNIDKQLKNINNHGLRNINNRVNLLGGEIKITSDEGGTSYNINIPVNCNYEQN